MEQEYINIYLSKHNPEMQMCVFKNQLYKLKKILNIMVLAFPNFYAFGKEVENIKNTLPVRTYLF